MTAAAEAGTADPTDPFHIADLNQDGLVGGQDLAVMLSQWGEEPNMCPPYLLADIDENCQVDGSDLAMVLGGWGETGIPGGSVAPPVLPPGVWSRNFPRPEDPLQTTVEVSGLAVTITNPDIGVIMDHPPATPYYGDGPLNVITIVDPAVNGFDVTYIITNPTAESRPLPTLWVDGYKLDDSIQGLDLRFGTLFETVTWSPTTVAITEQNMYPKTRYAPVAVAKGSRFSVPCNTR
jgi:hypothetical protein